MTSDAFDLFVNPAAGRGRALKRLGTIVTLMADAGIATTFRRSDAAGHLASAVRERAEAGAKALIVAGGDGSIHQAVNGVLAAGGKTALGIIPCGTGNDFAKAAGIPLDWREAATALAGRLADGTPARTVDAGRVNGRWYANTAGIGLDAKINALAHGFRVRLGDFVYVVAIGRAMFGRIATPALVVRGETFEHRGPATLVDVANGPWIGGNFKIAPPAEIGDGELDLVLVGPVTRRRIAALLPKLLRGTHLDEPEIYHRRTKRITVEAAEPMPWHLDGEPQEPADYFEVDVVPGALRLA